MTSIYTFIEYQGKVYKITHRDKDRWQGDMIEYGMAWLRINGDVATYIVGADVQGSMVSVPVYGGHTITLLPHPRTKSPRKRRRP